MAVRVSAKATQKAVSEIKEMLSLSLYLYICIGSIVLLKAATLQQAGMNYAVWGIAVVKALLLAKFILIGRAFNYGKRFGNRPLIWPTLYHAFMYLILLLILTTLEELLVGALHGRPAAESLTHVVGSTFLQAFSVSLVLFLILIPYSAFVSLSDVLGEREAIRLFFISRAADPAVRERPA